MFPVFTDILSGFTFNNTEREREFPGRNVFNETIAGRRRTLLLNVSCSLSSRDAWLYHDGKGGAHVFCFIFPNAAAGNSEKLMISEFHCPPTAVCAHSHSRDIITPENNEVIYCTKERGEFERVSFHLVIDDVIVLFC